MTISQHHKETAKAYFATSPSENVIHITSDGQVFFHRNYNDASNHQNRIKPGERLVTIYRKDIVEKPVADVDLDEEEDDGLGDGGDMNDGEGLSGEEKDEPQAGTGEAVQDEPSTEPVADGKPAKTKKRGNSKK